MASKKIAVVVCFIIALVKTSFAQTPEFLNNLQQYGAAIQQEKVYLHLDKPHYLTGDDIWLKGYVTIGVQNQLSALSKILYVDLIDPANKVVSNIKLLILNGTAIGDIHLADTLQQGTYHLRAYTNWMRNLPEETFFNKAFTIGRVQLDPAIIKSTFGYNDVSKLLKASVKVIAGNGLQLGKIPVQYELAFADKTAASGSAVTDVNGDISIQFSNSKNQDLKTAVLNLKMVVNGSPFQKYLAINVKPLENRISFMPEGGDMVAGSQSRVAFKILQPDGLAGAGNGYITDDSGEKLVEFISGYAGMGSFYMTPQAGKTYKAVITYANGQKQTTALPEALKEGFVLTLLPHLPFNVLLALKVSAGLVKNQKVTILVQRQGTVIYAGQKTISSAESLTKVPLDNFPPGIIQVTLFNENMQPMCERLFFNLNPHATLPLTAGLDNQNYKSRQLVSVNLNAGEATDTMRNGTFSASVVNLAGLPQLKDNETGILPGLLLTPELKGYVERPDHYFEAFDNARMAELDNLILCQGWRRIVWNDVKQGNIPAINYQPEKAFTISGTVTLRNGSPAANVPVSLLATKTFVNIDTVTNAKGRFVFDNLLLGPINRFSVHARDDKHTMVVKIDPPTELNGATPFNSIQYPDDAKYQSYLKTAYARLPDSVKKRMDSYHMLKQVTIKATQSKSKLVPSFSSNRNGPGNADEIFLADEMKYATTLKQFLQGRAMGIKFIDDTPFSTRTDNFTGGDNGPKAMTIILDGMEMNSDGDEPLNWIPVEDVASIEILRTAASSALYSRNNGVIIITTKTGKGALTYPSKSSTAYAPVVITGYQAIREFYTPNYTVASNSSPDHRITVFWKPDIVTDKAGNATFKFYTTDDKGTYQLTIEGITADGRPAHLVKNFVVE
ncbi:TonB-dependent receptor plug domain-containing protein [Mucilaginibacter sp. UYCu711]|uniref:carboxypeptidase-like regulatory domain-containing protein n=1 Tax=Mucilaginibacter sp. UYCu711 TaxID=3156339 RepID=UPI003D1CFDD3